MSEIRIGLGIDAHRLVEGRPLILGGVDVPFERGPLGHSDGDAVAHALMDAILGAMRAGDIGQYFPDTDESYCGISSMELLRRIASLMAEEGWRLADADCVVVLQAPKITGYRDRMRATMAEALGVDAERLGLKATTTEGLGYTGRGEGVEAQAVVLLERP